MTTVTADMISAITNDKIELNYLCKTPQVTYSIADFGGNVIKRGDFTCIESKTLLIDDLPSGVYTLCIIDGDQLSKSRFRKN
ncbi:MAG: hypothetical protein ACJ77K_11780 [Bacteroidia bacterium]